MSRSSIIHPSNNSIYSSENEFKHTEVTRSNTPDSIVISVFTEDSIPQPIAPTKQAQNSVVHRNISCIQINGRVVKGDTNWRITDDRNFKCYEIGSLNESKNRSGLSNLYLNGDLREIHEYNNDMRVGNYKIFQEIV